MQLEAERTGAHLCQGPAETAKQKPLGGQFHFILHVYFTVKSERYFQPRWKNDGGKQRENETGTKISLSGDGALCGSEGTGARLFLPDSNLCCLQCCQLTASCHSLGDLRCVTAVSTSRASLNIRHHCLFVCPAWASLSGPVNTPWFTNEPFSTC